ncbi:Protein CBG26529 [Caenorhabditis briggsae]|uniref:Protein CBG26529 n=1 Tax=Caenorhabditis briggsae TaxID=6238 RepID=B6IHW0_CAEBR|nr:Protein CBG26529 [Caenorhabditis briggsae]CAR99490.1 Protein CBG26529 [Caenorhabditis briggsae]
MFRNWFKIFFYDTFKNPEGTIRWRRGAAPATAEIFSGNGARDNHLRLNAPSAFLRLS